MSNALKLGNLTDKGRAGASGRRSAPMSREDWDRMDWEDRASWALDIVTVLALPALTVYLGLNAGGYFAGTTGWAAIALACLLAARCALTGGPLANPSWPLGVGASALALLGVWTLLSGSWADDRAGALLEADRILLYLLVLLSFASITRPRAAYRYLVPGFALAAAFLCGAGFLSRTLPDVWSAGSDERGWLAYPITYSNGLGILAVLGGLACLHLVCWERERIVLRLLGAAALPMVGATLVLTRSAGAVIAGAVGAILYVAVGRPRGLLTGLVATIPFLALAASAAAGVDLIAGRDALSAAAEEEGQDLARTVGLAMLGAAGVLGLLLPLERWTLPRVSLRPPLAVSAALVALVVAGIAVVAATRGDDLVRSAEERIGGAPTFQTRVDYWQVAVDGFEQDPLTGTGVGTFEQRWVRDRPNFAAGSEAHSLYIETLSELGVVGLALILVTLGALAVGIVSLARRPMRPVGAAALALGVAWLLHAGVDWDWELPAVTLWLFAFAGCALAGHARRRGVTIADPIRVVTAVACLLIAVTPIYIVISQSRLDGAVDAFLAGDCVEAEELAASASRVLPARAEPYEILGYCASRRGQHRRAVDMMEEANDRNTAEWDLTYGLAVARAAAGEDPRPAAARTRFLNPRGLLPLEATRRFRGADPDRWRAQASDAPLPIP
jgi:O-Antigen ligase